MFCNITTYATIEFLYNRNITLKIDNCIYIECKNNHAARTLHHGHLGKLILEYAFQYRGVGGASS